tara:strand:+ start:5295 stop:5615 length:321 start_codon:yes stop_codon:yes gene_type:complete
MQLIREYISELLKEVQGGGIGVQQQIGIGRNYHTVNPEPITWENYPGLNYDISSDLANDGVYASVEVLDYPELSTGVRKFSDEASAEFWVRDQYEQLHRYLMSLEN